jgi:hypothetical protein
MEKSAPPLVWRRPSDKDFDRLNGEFNPTIVVEEMADRIEAVEHHATAFVASARSRSSLLIPPLDCCCVTASVINASIRFTPWHRFLKHAVNLIYDSGELGPDADQIVSGHNQWTSGKGEQRLQYVV